MGPAKRRRVLNGVLIGTVSGLALSAVCYLAVAPDPSYFVFTAFGLAIGAGQAYLAPE